MDQVRMDTLSLREDKIRACIIPRDSVAELWENNFYDSSISLPPNHEIYNPLAWKDFVAFLIHCQEESVGVWSLLMRAAVPQDSVTAAVFLSLSVGGHPVHRLWACLGYVCMLSVEGANAYKLFHPVVFQLCVQCIGSVMKGGERMDDASTKSEELGMDADVGGSGEERVDEMGLIEKILEQIRKLLRSFRFQLHLDSLILLISSLFTIVRSSMEEMGAAAVGSLAWSCIEEVHRPLHGDEKEILSDVIKHLFPLLTFQTREGKNQSSISKSQQQLSEQAASYLRALLNTGLMEREARITFIVIPRHICIRCPPLTQHKARCARVVCELVSYLPDQEFSDFFRWFSSLLNSRRHEHRNVSVSVALEFILSTHKDCQVSLDSESQDRSNLPAFLLDCVVQRCSDSVCPVRTNALHALADLSTCSSLPHIQESLRMLLSVPGSSDNPLLSMLARRVQDEKAGVRKSALVALESLLRMLPSDVCINWAQLMRQRAFDPSLTVRKQVISSLRELLLLSPESRPMQLLFLSGLLPLVLDPESSVQERSSDVLFEEIFSRLSPYRSEASDSPLSWQLLVCISHENFLHQRYFLLLLQRLGKAGKLNKQLLLILLSYAGGLDHEDCWRLIALVSQQTDAICVDQVYSAWREAIDSPAHSQEIFSMVKVLANLHLRLSNLQADRIKSWLAESVEKFTLDPNKISISVNALILLCQQHKNPGNELTSWFSSWTARLICSCSGNIKDCLQGATGTADQPCSVDKLIPSLSLLGELITVSPETIDPVIPPLVQWALIQRSRQNLDKSFSDNIHFSDRTRAFVCILFGKLCLVKQDLAYDSADLLAEELFTSNSVSLKNNIIIILCDLCIRYPNLIENYLSHISPCLRDPSYVVRKHTLTLLTQLIQEDYIKLRGTLIYHLLAVINDSELRELVEYCLTHVLLKKYPRAFYHHFIESIFYFQDNHNHPSINQFSKTPLEVDRFALPGDHNTKKRFCIYNYMLDQLTDEQRFNLSARIVQDILGSTVDGMLKLADANYPIITDALSILCSDEIKLSCVKTHSVENLEDDEREAMEAAVTLQSDMIKTLVKKDVIDNIIPTIISVKRVMQKERSPLLSHLMCYLYRLKDDYKDKFTEVLAADKQLTEEIEFDIKRYEEDLAQVRRNANVRASLSAAESALSNPNFSPLLLLSPLSTTVTKTLKRVRIPARIENSPSVLQLNRLTSIRGETRRKVISPLSIACNSPAVNEADGSPDLQKTKKRNKAVNKTRTVRIRPTAQQDEDANSCCLRNKPSAPNLSFLATPPVVEQDILLNSFESSPLITLDNTTRANIIGSAVSGSNKGVISFSPTIKLSEITRTWNLSLREERH